METIGNSNYYTSPHFNVNNCKNLMSISDTSIDTLENQYTLSLKDDVVEELVKKMFLNNFDFSYLERIFKKCSSEELKLIHNNYEYIIKLVEKHYFNKV